MKSVGPRRAAQLRSVGGTLPAGPRGLGSCGAPFRPVPPAFHGDPAGWGPVRPGGRAGLCEMVTWSLPRCSFPR